MLKKIPLYGKIIIGLVLGIVYALLSSWLGWQLFTTHWIAPFGDIFINLLKLIAVPLILFSIISGIVSLGNPKDLGKLGARTLGVYLLTTITAVSLGLLLVNMVTPGKLLSDEVRIENRIAYEDWAKQQGIPVIGGIQKDQLLAFTLRMEIGETDAKEKKTEVTTTEIPQLPLAKDSGPLQPLVDIVPKNIFKALSGGGSMLQIIFFAILFGIGILFAPTEKTKTLVQFIDGTSEVFIKMVDIIMKGAPFFVFALMAGVVNDMAGDNPAKVLELFKGLTWYSVTVLTGLLLMAFLIYPSVLKLFDRNRRFGEFLRGISPAQALAFSTSSSAATLPVTFECVEENLKVDKKTAGFVLPIGATINMDGTSLYQAVAVLFLAQMHMIDLSLAQQLTIVLTATLASIGSAAVPSAGLVMLMVVLTSVDLNPAWIAIILPIDRILDMVRTVVNVTGDATVACVMDKYVED
jgi:Na+/H+-dicarboxylate symporter